jgi:hypothetical protein
LVDEAVVVEEPLLDELVLEPVPPPLPLARPPAPAPLAVDEVEEVPPALCVALLEADPAMAEAEAITNNAEVATPTRILRYVDIV